MPRSDDFETAQIGKLIDAGHPRLAASTFRSRWRFRLMGRALALIPLAGAVAWHWMRG